MRSNLEILLFLLRRGVISARDSISFYVDDFSNSPGDLWEWIKENKLKVTLIAGGVLVIVIPLAIGFGPAGIAAGSIAAGWQSGIGAVAAGSLFATVQSMAMTGVFTGIGAGLIATGLLGWAKDWLKLTGAELKLVYDQLMDGKVLEWFGGSCKMLGSRAAGALKWKGEEGPDPTAARGHEDSGSLNGLDLFFHITGAEPNQGILISSTDICPSDETPTAQTARFDTLQGVLAEEGYRPGTYTLTWRGSDSCDIVVRTQRGLATQLRTFFKECQGNKPVPSRCYYRLDVNENSFTTLAHIPQP